MKVPVQFYRSYPMDPSAQHPAIGHRGLADKMLALDADRTVVAGMHLWNVGEPGGPDVTPDGPDWPITKLYDFYADAQRIAQNKIRPVFQAARAAGITVVHIAGNRYAHHYPQYARTVANCDEPDPAGSPGCCDRSWQDEYHRDKWGMSIDEANQELDRVKSKIRIAQCVAPHPEDEVVKDHRQFNRLLRSAKVNTIIYTGFATNACLMAAPGGLLDMRRLKYRLILVRDATAALEEKRSCLDRGNMKTTIAQVEREFGYTCTADDLIAAMQKGASRS